MNTTEILDAIIASVEVLKKEHASKFNVSRQRARSAANEIKNLSTEFKKTSLVEDKTK